MFEFKKKDTPIGNIAFISIMAAINVIFALLFAFLPYIIFILILILPLTSVLVALYCQKRYYPLYIIVTLGLCFVSAIWDITIPIFYILPAMITGFIFAVFIKIKIPNLYLIFISTMIQMFFAYIAIAFSEFVLKINIIDTIANLLALQNFDLFYVIVPSFIFLISLIQSVFSYMIIKDELPKFGYVINDQDKFFLLNIIACYTSILLSVIFAFFMLDIAYLCMMISFLFGIEIAVKTCLKKNKLYIILNCCFFVISLLLFAIVYQYMPHGSGFLILTTFNFASATLALFDLLNKLKKDKMNKVENK